MFKKAYQHFCDQITPTDALINQTLQAVQKQQKSPKSASYVLRKPIIAFVAVCFCLFMGMPSLAAAIEPIYQLMYLVSPSVAQFFIPVQQSDEDNGIKMEVVSAYIYENTAEIYITMQDLTDKRIDDTTDLYDSYAIHRPFSSSARCELIGYEADLNTATFLITIDEWGNKKIDGDKITFSVREFLSHKSQYENIAIPLDLSAASIAEHIQTVTSSGGGGMDYESYQDNPIALIPSSPKSEFKVNGMELTGIGYIDGKLHLQTAVKDPLDNDNHGFFYLMDGNGAVIDSSYSFSFFNQYEQPGQIKYCEFVFDIPHDQIASYTLHGDFVTSGLKTEGNWKVTFPLEYSE